MMIRLILFSAIVLAIPDSAATVTDLTVGHLLNQKDTAFLLEKYAEELSIWRLPTERDSASVHNKWRNLYIRVAEQSAVEVENRGETSRTQLNEENDKATFDFKRSRVFFLLVFVLGIISGVLHAPGFEIAASSNSGVLGLLLLFSLIVSAGLAAIGFVGIISPTVGYDTTCFVIKTVFTHYPQLQQMLLTQCH
jgi:hypothetical protein